MAEKAGSIKYTVDADTSPMLKAERVVNKTTNKIVDDFKKVDTASEKSANKIKKTTKAVDSALTAQARASERAARTSERAAERKSVAAERTAERAVRAAEKSSASEIAAANKTAKETTRAANQAAAARITAQNKTARATVIANKRSAAAEQKRIAGFGRSSGQAGIQIQQFVGQIQGGQNAMLALSQQSADLGFVLGAPLVGAIVGISASLIGFLIPSLSQSDDNVKELSVSLKSLIDRFGELSDSQKNVAKSALTEQLKKQKREANDLQNTVNTLRTALIEAERASGGKLFDRLLGSDPVKAREELEKARASLTALNLERAKTLEQLKSLSTEDANLTKEQKKLKETTLGLVQSLKAQMVSLKDGEEAAFRFATAQQLGLKVGEQIPANIDDQISALFRLKKAQEESKKEESAKTRLGGQVATIGLTPEQNIIDRFQRQNEILKEAREKDLLTEMDFMSRTETLQAQHEENIKKLREKGTSAAIINFEALENQAIGTFASIASGAQNGKDAIKSLAQSILTQMIGALIKMGVQALIGQTTAAATGAATAASLSASYATPAALASLASFGANSVPASAGIAATVGLAQTLSLAGGREHGGAVQAGKMYQFGEGGKPEIFTSGGKNFMIPGDNGRVKSNSDSFGGQSFNQTVIIENNTTSNVSTKTSEDGKNLRISINEVANQITTQQGPIWKALRNSTNVTGKANR